MYRQFQCKQVFFFSKWKPEFFRQNVIDYYASD